MAGEVRPCYIRCNVGLCSIACQTLWCWSRLYLGYKAAQARGRMLDDEQRKEFWQQKHGFLAERMWSNIAELRGWWVKVGQFLSTRSDMLPDQYIRHLAKLQDMMPTSNFSVIKEIVETELGKPISEVFESFEKKAIASASIGQVHKAVLRNSGEQVVVKVQHPGVEKTLRQDMMTLTQMTWAFGMLEKGMNFSPILIEWQKAAANELDFRMELQFQERAREAAIKSGIDVIIPRCHPEFTTPKVMVMEFCEGFKITDVENIAKYNVDVDALMTKICESFAYQIHVDGMFNGDPHPGNILVQVNPETKVATPVLLDWGLVKSFTHAERIAFAKTVFAVASMDVMGLMAAFEEMGFVFKTDSIQDPEIYMDALRVGFFRDSSDSGGEKKTTVNMVKESGINRETVMKENPIDDWPKDIIFFIRVASLLHGLSLQLKAKIPLLQLLVEKAEQCLLERYIPRSPAVYLQYPPFPGGRARSQLEWKVFRLLSDLMERRRLILGCQVAVVYHNRLIVDVTLGRSGPVDRRPVQRDSLFCLMTVSNALLITAILKLVDEKKLRLEDPVCHWWDGFIRFGKQDITVGQVLSHRAGLHRSLPKNLTLTKLADYETMISLLEDAVPAKPNGQEGGCYAYLVSGWIFSEIIGGVTGRRADEYLSATLLQRLRLSNDIFYPVPRTLLAMARRSVVSPADDHRRPRTPSLPPLSQEVPPSGKEALAETPRALSPRGTPLSSANDAQIKTIEMGLDEILRLQSISRQSRYPPQKPPGSPTNSARGQSQTEGPSRWLQGGRTEGSSTTVTLKKPAEGFTATPRGRSASEIPPPQEGTPRLMKSEAGATFLNRFICCRRQIGVAKMSSQEVAAKLRSAKQAVARQAGRNLALGGRTDTGLYISKHMYDQRQVSAAKKQEVPRVTAVELAKEKPHVLDPLIYDSTRIQPLFIPPTNCRATAAAVARLFGKVADGTLVSADTLQLVSDKCLTLIERLAFQAAKPQSIDRTLDALLLTGGGSRVWGLGYQLYPCVSYTRRDRRRSSAWSQLSGLRSTTDNMVWGLGHGDLGGNILVFFPKLKVSICILVNDVLTGPAASKEILRVILAAFGLVPAWDVPYTLEQIARGIATSVKERTKRDYTSLTMLNRCLEVPRSAVRIIEAKCEHERRDLGD